VDREQGHVVDSSAPSLALREGERAKEDLQDAHRKLLTVAKASQAQAVS